MHLCEKQKCVFPKLHQSPSVTTLYKEHLSHQGCNSNKERRKTDTVETQAHTQLFQNILIRYWKDSVSYAFGMWPLKGTDVHTGICRWSICKISRKIFPVILCSLSQIELNSPDCWMWSNWHALFWAQQQRKPPGWFDMVVLFNHQQNKIRIAAIFFITLGFITTLLEHLKHFFPCPQHYSPYINTKRTLRLLMMIWWEYMITMDILQYMDMI